MTVLLPIPSHRWGHPRPQTLLTSSTLALPLLRARLLPAPWVLTIKAVLSQEPGGPDTSFGVR